MTSIGNRPRGLPQPARCRHARQAQSSCPPVAAEQERAQQFANQLGVHLVESLVSGPSISCDPRGGSREIPGALLGNSWGIPGRPAARRHAQGELRSRMLPGSNTIKAQIPKSVENLAQHRRQAELELLQEDTAGLHSSIASPKLSREAPCRCPIKDTRPNRNNNPTLRRSPKLKLAGTGRNCPAGQTTGSDLGKAAQTCDTAKSAAPAAKTLNSSLSCRQQHTNGQENSSEEGPSQRGVQSGHGPPSALPFVSVVPKAAFQASRGTHSMCTPRPGPPSEFSWRKEALAP